MTDTISRIALDTAKNSRGDGEIFEHKRYGNGVAGKGKVDFAEEILWLRTVPITGTAIELRLKRVASKVKRDGQVKKRP